MEIVALFALICLLLILVSGYTKGKRAKRLAENITEIKTALEHRRIQSEDLPVAFSSELKSIAANLARIEATAVLEHEIIWQIVQWLPVSFCDADDDERLRLIVQIAKRLWGRVSAVLGRPGDKRIDENVQLFPKQTLTPIASAKVSTSDIRTGDTTKFILAEITVKYEGVQTAQNLFAGETDSRMPRSILVDSL